MFTHQKASDQVPICQAVPMMFTLMCCLIIMMILKALQLLPMNMAMQSIQF